MKLRDLFQHDVEPRDQRKSDIGDGVLRILHVMEATAKQ